MHKEESDNKINEKNSPENNNINPKAKLPKEKKSSQKNSTTPKIRKKKCIFPTQKIKKKIHKQKIILLNQKFRL